MKHKTKRLMKTIKIKQEFLAFFNFIYILAYNIDMFKNKVKLSLIDDYIRIVLIENFNNNSFEMFELDEDLTNTINKTKAVNSELKEIYEHIFDAMKLNDMSLLVLKKELKSNNNLYKRTINKNLLNLIEVLNRNFLELSIIKLNLKKKLQTLQLNLSITG